MESIKFHPETGVRLPNQLIYKLTSSFYGCSFLKFSTNGRLLACAVIDKDNFSIIKLIDIATKSDYCCLYFHVGIVHELNWSSSSRYLISCSSDNTVKLFKIPKESIV